MRYLLPGLLALLGLSASAEPSREEVFSAMRRATEFAFEQLAYRNGFVWFRTLDLEPYGELKARPSMVWVEPPSTPSVGIMLLEAYRITQDAYYLDKAKAVAETLIAGQHASGGWHYFIDFEPAGLQAYYDAFFSKCWGWQEYLKKRDNCTFDDYTTTEPTRFFLRLYAAAGDPRHRAALDKALEHILRAQYPAGGWPQRYPVDDDYSAAITLNDDVSLDCILVLLEAEAQLGEARYGEAARRGMDFYLKAQLPAPQAGWAQQYDPETLKPVWGRPFELPAVCAPQTHTNILDLFRFHGITGDSKFLDPVPAALDWLEASVIPGAEGYTHTCFYELGSNRPQYILQTGSTVEDVVFTPTYEEAGAYPYATRLTIPMDWLRKEYARRRGMTPEAARAEHAESLRGQALPAFVRGHYLALALGKTEQSPEGLRKILEEMDEQGGWRDEISLLDPFQPFTVPATSMVAYTTGGYLARMYRLMNGLSQVDDSQPSGCL